MKKAFLTEAVYNDTIAENWTIKHHNVRVDNKKEIRIEPFSFIFPLGYKSYGLKEQQL